MTGSGCQRDANTGDPSRSGEIVLPNSLASAYTSVTDESFESRGIMFDIAAPTHNISIVSLEFYVADNESVEIDVHATCCKTYSFNRVRRHPGAWNLHSTIDSGLSPPAPSTLSIDPPFSTASNGAYMVEISKVNLIPICVLAEKSVGIFIYVKNGPSLVNRLYGQGIGDVYASQTELGDKILIQTKIGIGTTADKFYPPYNNGLLFDGTLSYQYAEQEGPIYRENSGFEYEESSSFSRTPTWLLSGTSVFFLSFVLFVL